jgi:hypothetical protein
MNLDEEIWELILVWGYIWMNICVWYKSIEFYYK